MISYFVWGNLVRQLLIGSTRMFLLTFQRLTSHILQWVMRFLLLFQMQLLFSYLHCSSSSQHCWLQTSILR
uniref:Uncharacterized protein n=1 Tax=Arundo donax TaxID=35708 RepID=A0A0A9DY89_ARUDO